MNKNQWYLVSLSALLLSVWMVSQFFQTQNALSAPLEDTVSVKRILPGPSPLIRSIIDSYSKSSQALKEDSQWGITTPINPKNPPINAVLFTPAIANKPPRICVGLQCYEFLGLTGNKALFYDTNISATKKTLTLDRGKILFKPIRVKQITRDSAVLIDMKTKTTYELSLFKIDLAPYKPKSDPKKGK